MIIGSNEKAVELYKEITGQEYSSGNDIIGFTHVHQSETYLLDEYLPHFGNCVGLRATIEKHEIEEVVIAVESSEHDSLGSIITELEGLNVVINVIPDMYDILSGSVKMTSIFGTPLIVITRNIMPVWQQSVKRIIDVLTAILVLISFAPFYIITALIVWYAWKWPKEKSIL